VVSTAAGATAPGTQTPEGTPTSVEGLFTIVAQEQASADRVAVSYDARGVPTKIDIDRVLNAIDDEESFLVTMTPAS
jgi:hypothetical protein